MASISGSEAAARRPRKTRSGTPETLRRMFEDLGLSPYETRVLLALLRTGSSNSSQLARLADVPRTSTYAVLESLSEKGLVHRLPGDGPSMWGTPGPDEVLERLESAKEAAQEEQLRLYRGRIEDARRLLAETVLEQPALSLPYVHFVRGAAQVKKAYEQLIGGAEREVLMFNRPPYTWDPEQVNPAVLDLLERGVETRVLYQAAQWRDAEAAEFRASHLEYHRAGVQARLVEALPIKLAIGDRRVALTGMRGSLQPVDDRGIPTNLLIEDPGMAEVLAHAFEHLWAEGEPV